MSPPANPRARVGHDFGGRFATSGLEISIRAPAWGATSEAQRRALPERVSIRAPAWGATCIVWMASTMLSFQSTRPRGARHISPSADLTGSVFQSTCPRGARRDEAGVLQHESLVSIHAPAWGATRRSPRCRPRCRCFNPRARVGRDAGPSAPACRPARFNPRARVGRDVPGAPTNTAIVCFNPRAHMGRDETTRTATLRPTSFNPRAHVGRDATYSMIARWQTSFNPRARAGRDLLKSFIHDLTSTFQSTRPRGARPRMSGCRYRTTGFNPRARVGRDHPWSG